MIKNLMQLYSLSICFVCSLITLVCLIFLFQAVIDLTFFDIRYKNELEHYKDNQTYVFTTYGHDNLSEGQLTEKRLIKKNDFIESKKTSSLNTIINMAIGITVSLIFLAIHFRIYKRIS